MQVGQVEVEDDHIRPRNFEKRITMAAFGATNRCCTRDSTFKRRLRTPRTTVEPSISRILNPRLPFINPPFPVRARRESARARFWVDASVLLIFLRGEIYGLEKRHSRRCDDKGRACAR